MEASLFPVMSMFAVALLMADFKPFKLDIFWLEDHFNLCQYWKHFYFLIALANFLKNPVLFLVAMVMFPLSDFQTDSLTLFSYGRSSIWPDKIIYFKLNYFIERTLHDRWPSNFLFIITNLLLLTSAISPFFSIYLLSNHNPQQSSKHHWSCRI